MAHFCAISFFLKFLDEYRLNFIFFKFSRSFYSAPATVKFYTLSNFGRANKLRLISYKQAGCQIFRKEKLEFYFLKKRIFNDLFFLLIKFEIFPILRYNIYRKSRKTKKNKTLLSWE